MNKDQGIGAVLLLASIVGVVLYFWLVFLSPWWTTILQLTAFVAVGFVLFILGWIGYTLATTPPPKPIEEIEKEIEKETKEEAKEVKEESPPPPPS
jgi:predicted DNA-binding transcriptional regulator